MAAMRRFSNAQVLEERCLLSCERIVSRPSWDDDWNAVSFVADGDGEMPRHHVAGRSAMLNLDVFLSVDWAGDHLHRICGPVAQLAEQQTLNLRVLGSIPSWLTTFPV